jgi:hypothetical protein
MPGKRYAANLLAERASDCGTRPDAEGKDDRGAQRSNLQSFPPRSLPRSRPPLRCSCPAAHLVACMRAQDVKARPKKPRRQRLPWMKDDEGTPAASGDLLTAATATARVAATAVVATEAAMAAAAAEAAEVGMAATAKPLRTNQPLSHRLSCHTFVYAGASGAQEGQDHSD